MQNTQKKSKILYLILLLVLLLGILSGCGQKANDTSGDTVITFWSPDGGSKAVMAEMVNEFNNTIGKDNNVKLEYAVKEGDLKQQVELSLKTGNAPDLFVTSGIDKLSTNGDIIAIEDMPGGKEFLKRYEGSLINDVHVYDGKTYCVPFSVNLYGLVYNKDMFKKAGLVDENGEAMPPETFDEVREYAKKLTNKSEKEFGIIFPCKWTGFYNSEILPLTQSSYGRRTYNPLNGEYDFSVLQKPIEMVMNIKSDESCYPGAESIDNDTARARFAEGRIGMKFAVSWDVGVLNDQFPAKCDWGVAPLPVENKDEKYLQFRSGTYGPYINAASAKSKDPEKIMLVYEWFHSDDLLKTLYQQGAYIPWDYEIIRNVKVENPKKGWEEFAQLNEISCNSPLEIKTDITGQSSMSDLFFKNIWPETMSIDDAIQQANTNYNNGIKKYKELYPDYDSSIAIDKDWMIKR